jgi:hypothetical protein
MPTDVYKITLFHVWYYFKYTRCEVHMYVNNSTN